MSYFVRYLRKRKAASVWKVQCVSYKEEDYIGSNAKFPRRTWDISKERWRSLGFHASLELSEAKVRAKQLNAQLLLKRHIAWSMGRKMFK